jgi:Icc protein
MPQAVNRTLLKKERPPMRFAILSDTHLLPTHRQPFNNNQRFLIDTLAQFAEALERFREIEPQPELVIFCGDLVHMTNPSEGDEYYQLFRECAAELSCPFYVLPGNHDLREPFRRLLLEGQELQSEKLYYAFDHGGSRFFLLDSLDEMRVEGRISPKQIKWLCDELDACAPQPSFIFMHHPPLDIGIGWLDELRLENGEELLAALEGRSNIKKIFFSHAHQFIELSTQGLELVSCPPTAMTFSAHAWDSMSDAPPAMLIVDFDGQDTQLTVIELGKPGFSPNPDFTPQP